MFWPRALILTAVLGMAVGSAGAMGVDRELPVKSAATAAAEEYPVRWSSSLGLDSLDNLERRLEEPLWNAVGILLARRWRYVGEGEAPEPIEPKRILSCADYWAADFAHLNTRSQSDHNLLREFAADCTALNTLGSARPAQVSFVGDIRLDERAADVLPAGTAIAISPVERREIDDADAKGWSWRQWHKSRESGLASVNIAADGIRHIRTDARP